MMSPRLDNCTPSGAEVCTPSGGVRIYQHLVSVSLDEQLTSGAEGCIFISTFHIISQAVAQPRYNNNH